MKRRRIMTGVVTEEWTRHLGMFLDDLYDNVPGLGINTFSRFLTLLLYFRPHRTRDVKCGLLRSMMP